MAGLASLPVPLLHGTGGTCVSRPQFYNIAKPINVGSMLRTCTAFGVREALVVGKKKALLGGDRGTRNYLAQRHFYTFADAAEYVRSRGMELVGVEITGDAENVNALPFRGPTAFVVGNEGSGLNSTALRHVDRLVYVPMQGRATASLNVGVALGIVLNAFAHWAGAPEAPRDGTRFSVDPQQRIPAVARAVAEREAKK